MDGFIAKNYPGQEKEMFEKLSKTQPVLRMATPEDIAAIALRDDAQVLEFFKNAWSHNDLSDVAEKVLSNTNFWDTDLTAIDGLQKEVTKHLQAIVNNGMKATLDAFVK